MFTRNYGQIEIMKFLILRNDFQALKPFFLISISSNYLLFKYFSVRTFISPSIIVLSLSLSSPSSSSSSSSRQEDSLFYPGSNEQTFLWVVDHYHRQDAPPSTIITIFILILILFIITIVAIIIVTNFIIIMFSITILIIIIIVISISIVVSDVTSFEGDELPSPYFNDDLGCKISTASVPPTNAPKIRTVSPRDQLQIVSMATSHQKIRQPHNHTSAHPHTQALTGDCPSLLDSKKSFDWYFYKKFFFYKIE